MFMLRITLILLLFLILPDIYIYCMHIARKKRHFLWNILYWIPTTAVIIACIAYFSDINALSHHTIEIGRLAIIIMLLCVPKLVFMICSIIGKIIHYVIRPIPMFPFVISGIIIGMICFGGCLYGSVWGITRFEIKEVDYHSTRLPKGFDGYRIVQLSDLHLGSWEHNPKAIQEVVNMVNEQSPDLIVFTGDIVNQQSHEIDSFTSILSQLKAPDGIYSTLGNHDYGTYYHWDNAIEATENLQYLKDRQAEMGWKMLNNDHAILYHKGDSIALIGVENDGEPPFSQHADLPRAMKGTEGMFRILLSHNPTHWRREVLPTTDIDLTLAGHTHAMQMELFGHSPAVFKYSEWKGMYKEGEQSLYVNIGLGYVGLPFRFGAWPEITVFTLHE